jgi:hypothetical protein
MIRPIIHRKLTRGDLACLVARSRGWTSRSARPIKRCKRRRGYDLDSSVALEAVLGGGAPALPLTLLAHRFVPSCATAA